MQQAFTVKPVSFRQFVWVYHKQPLLFAILGMSTLFVVYKILYPFPDTYVDSYHYLHLAADSNFLSVWPLGYSYFLRVVHFITPSHLFLIAVQFVLLQAACLWLAFTVFYIFQPSSRLKNGVLVFLVCNPLSYYLANLISSDILFTALSIVWVTVLIKMIHDAQYWHVLLQGPLMAVLFMIRYQAAYYPIIMIAALCFTPINKLWKVLSAALGLVLLGWVVHTTRQRNLQQYGRAEFSAQSGWILANNALYMYPFIETDTAAFADARQVQLDAEVRAFFVKNGLMQQPYWPWDGPQYMLGGDGGLMWNHLGKLVAAQPDKPTFWLYSRMGKHWGNYGKLLIRQHPFAYLRYYVLPNTLTYFLPLPEQFNIYNMGTNKVPAHVAAWFLLKNRRVEAVWPQGSFYLLWVFRPLFLLLNLALLVAGISLYKKRNQLMLHVVQQHVLLVLGLCFLGNAGLLIIAAPVMLRYQAFALLLGILLLVAMMAALKRQTR